MDFGNMNISNMLSGLNLSSLNLSGMLSGFNMSGLNMSQLLGSFDLSALLNSLFNNNQKNNTSPATNPHNHVTKKHVDKYVPTVKSVAKTFTVKRASDGKIITQGRVFTLGDLNKLFNMDFTNGHLKVYIDGELVFEGDVKDDLSRVIFEIIQKFLGKHDIKVEFTGSDGKTNTYTETLIIE